MLGQFYSPLEGQALLIVDALLMLILLVSGHFYPLLKRPFWSWALFGLCWSAIVVAAAAAQQSPMPIIQQ